MSRATETLRVKLWLPPLVAFALVLVAWEAEAAHNHYVIPTVGSVWAQLVQNPGTLLSNGLATLAEALPGVAISYAVALLLAVAMDQSPIINRAVLPLAVALNVSPLIAIAPALVVGLGFGRSPRIVMTALITFFPALINSITGLRSADPRAVDVFQTLNASRWETLWHLQLPSSLPYLFAAARVVVPLSIVGAAISEMVAGGINVGLGVKIQLSAVNGQLALAWAGIVTLAAFGLLLTGVVLVIESRVLRWRGFR